VSSSVRKQHHPRPTWKASDLRHSMDFLYRYILEMAIVMKYKFVLCRWGFIVYCWGFHLYKDHGGTDFHWRNRRV